MAARGSLAALAAAAVALIAVPSALGDDPTATITSAPPALSSSSSATFEFTASEPDAVFRCRLDDANWESCSSPHTYEKLAEGEHEFRVRAFEEGYKDPGPTARHTWTIDATPPVLTLPPDQTLEADGPGGSIARYVVTAADDGVPLSPSAIRCEPASGSRFAVGRTAVRCSATDAAGNRREGSFGVVVRDTTPPVVNPPDVTLTATTAAGIRRTDAALADYLSSVSATDLVSSPTVTNDAPALLPVGTTGVTFTARDAAGNTASKTAAVTVVRPSVTAKRDVTPPADVRRGRAIAGDRMVTLSWVPPARDFASAAVFRSRDGRSGRGSLVYRGSKRRIIARGLTNAVRYRFLVVAYDRAGNRSRGIVLHATPARSLLVGPRANARMSSPPLLRWVPVRTASYYNVQLWRSGHKLLSTWPAQARLQLSSSWRHDGRRYRLTPGVYTWFVWPGVGPKSQARYGALLGKSTFVVVSSH
jgi:HYR domain